ncbi:hypothetical protein BDK51DRAFT_27863 [Blyttiomyces helicus]|uniref:Uncharacterized protein n=1 Tax=Blyttiomyces helicus TaxID=388810 RepID=A0A4P9WRM5_9FUNG|nr:hypothetical protein BDK51DRAFT_27863 [Blyttiomyces helicus]|eukprot:RKO93940.1 hypothetical protein BDK51DRAFT_27863 [Blyttiomyces helicus]
MAIWSAQSAEKLTSGKVTWGEVEGLCGKRKLSLQSAVPSVLLLVSCKLCFRIKHQLFLQPGFIYFDKNGIPLSAAASMENLVDPESAGEGVARHYVVGMMKINAFGATACSFKTDDITSFRQLTQPGAACPPLGFKFPQEHDWRHLLYIPISKGSIPAPPVTNPIFDSLKTFPSYFIKHSFLTANAYPLAPPLSCVPVAGDRGSLGAGGLALYMERDDDFDFDDDLDMVGLPVYESSTHREATPAPQDQSAPYGYFWGKPEDPFANDPEVEEVEDFYGHYIENLEGRIDSSPVLGHPLIRDCDYETEDKEEGV